MEKMTEEKAAYRLFDQGFDCAQATLSHFAEALDLDEETALKVASGFGGGMHRGDECGCVTGGLMALGMKYGFSEPNDTVGKGIMNAKAQQFLARFKEKFGSVYCRDLIEADVTTDEGKMKAGENIPKRCPGFVKGACDILEEMLNE
ncbi:MAG: C_GCAxxG_C_C family protein [Papillibacter sp.]|jgi:C_GCAxxG_C_C family probable redox protein|nr:C_GCAxxG_C_C family protein [Papillibacter sp.]